MQDIKTDKFMFCKCKTCGSSQPIVELQFDDKSSSIICLSCDGILENSEDLQELTLKEVEELGFSEELVLFLLQEKLEELITYLGDGYSVEDTSLEDAENDFDGVELYL